VALRERLHVQELRELALPVRLKPLRRVHVVEPDPPNAVQVRSDGDHPPGPRRVARAKQREELPRKQVVP
jgi:hypothetical protein